ncbi:MAG: hypothetical protein ACPG44_07505 [Polaribacter sp.]
MVGYLNLHYDKIYFPTSIGLSIEGFETPRKSKKGNAIHRKMNRKLLECVKRKRKKEATERNPIEAKFGQRKNGYNLNKIRARLKDTSQS